jgi:hypothetical protein
MWGVGVSDLARIATSLGAQPMEPAACLALGAPLRHRQGRTGPGRVTDSDDPAFSCLGPGGPWEAERLSPLGPRIGPSLRWYTVCTVHAKKATAGLAAHLQRYIAQRPPLVGQLVRGTHGAALDCT